jgi:hypothetical protein
MRPVVRDHRHQLAADRLGRALLRDLVVNLEIRNERGVLEAVGVITLRLDVGLQMDIGIAGRPHHAGGLHRYRLQVDRDNFHARTNLWLADRVFQRERGRSKGDDGDCRREHCRCPVRDDAKRAHEAWLSVRAATWQTVRENGRPN